MIPDQAKSLNIETLPFAQPVETGRVDGAVTLLLAHIVSTRCRGDIITDADMDYPKDWRALNGRPSKDCGHQPEGMTVGLHSLAVLPRVHRCGMGQLIMKAFLDQMKSCRLVERVALICQDVSTLRPLLEKPLLCRANRVGVQHLVSYYERSGYKHVGESKAQFGGGGWHDMVGCHSYVYLTSQYRAVTKMLFRSTIYHCGRPLLRPRRRLRERRLYELGKGGAWRLP